MDGVIRGALSLDAPLRGSIVTVGTFDGVHRGHQVLVGRAKRAAGESLHPVVAYTFDPHPARLFAPSAPKTLMPLDRRVAALRAAGADLVLVERFDEALAQVEAEDWVERFLGRLRPEHVVVGFNFSYGRGRRGDPEHLRAMGDRLGFTVEVVEAVSVDGRIASSTEVRRAVAAGRVDEARRLLGRPFTVVGRVERGDQRGRRLGFPTANIRPEHEQLPALGVYAGWLERLDGPHAGARHAAVVNVGRRPTFGLDAITVEAHALDARPELYDARVAVELVERLRGERAFDGPEALRAQIAVDVEKARAALGSTGSTSWG